MATVEIEVSEGCRGLDSETSPTREQRDHVLALQFGLMTADSGEPVDPADVAVNVTTGSHRLTTRRRFSFVSWVSSAEYSPFWRLMKVDGRPGPDEVPLPFRGHGLRADDESVRQSDNFFYSIGKKELFAIAEFRALAQSFCRMRSITLSTQAQLIHLFSSFELCFGALTRGEIERTYGRMLQILQKLEGFHGLRLVITVRSRTMRSDVFTTDRLLP